MMCIEPTASNVVVNKAGRPVTMTGVPITTLLWSQWIAVLSQRLLASSASDWQSRRRNAFSGPPVHCHPCTHTMTWPAGHIKNQNTWTRLVEIVSR